MTRLLYRQTDLLFGVILALVLWAFWSSYFSRLFNQTDPYVQAHALSQTLWCVLLLVQGVAIRRKQFRVHKRIAVVSPVVACVITVSTLALMYHRLPHPPLMDWYLKVTAFNVATLATFALLYFLAMYHRDDHHLHAGYMACTVFPLFTAFGSRLIQESTPLVELSMSIFGSFVALGQASLIPADITSVVLSVWDWRSNRRLAVFPVALASLLAIHAAAITLYRVPMWKSAVEMFANAR